MVFFKTEYEFLCCCWASIDASKGFFADLIYTVPIRDFLNKYTIQQIKHKCVEIINVEIINEERLPEEKCTSVVIISWTLLRKKRRALWNGAKGYTSST